MLKSHPQVAIYLEKTKIIVGDFRSKEPSYYENILQADVFTSLSTIIKSLPAASYLFIVSPDFSYTVTLPVVGSDILKDQVHQELAGYIPETFTSTQFDWKQVTSNQVEAVVLTHYFFEVIQKLKQVFKDLDFNIISLDSLSTELKLDISSDSTISKDILSKAISNLVLKGSDPTTLNIDLADPQLKRISKYNLLLILSFCLIIAIISYVLLTYLQA